jgi:hypothetical protein
MIAVHIPEEHLTKVAEPDVAGTIEYLVSGLNQSILRNRIP